MTWTLTNYSKFLRSLRTEKLSSTTSVDLLTLFIYEDAKSILQRFKINIRFVDSLEAARQAISDIAEQKDVIGCDIETTPY